MGPLELSSGDWIIFYMMKALVSQFPNQSVHFSFDVYHVAKKGGVG